MLSMKLIGNTSAELKKAKALYYRAFPKNERRSFPELVENRFGGTEVFCFYDGEAFVGMACVLKEALNKSSAAEQRIFCPICAV